MRNNFFRGNRMVLFSKEMIPKDQKDDEASHISAVSVELVLHSGLRAGVCDINYTHI